jgi:putative NIF3 family GTP cyclohydrolase 1 type 2
MSLGSFLGSVNERLGTASMLWAGASSEVSRVAVVGGAAAGEWKAALRAGADTFVTGEVPQNIALEASESGMTVLASGHYATEQPGCEDLCSRLGELGLEAELFVPEAGAAGRPLV